MLLGEIISLNRHRPDLLSLSVPEALNFLDVRANDNGGNTKVDYSNYDLHLMLWVCRDEHLRRKVDVHQNGNPIFGSPRKQDVRTFFRIYRICHQL